MHHKCTEYFILAILYNQDKITVRKGLLQYGGAQFSLIINAITGARNTKERNAG